MASPTKLHKTLEQINLAYQKALNTPHIQMPHRLIGLPHAEEKYYKFLYFLAREMQAVLSLELGVYLGTGVAHLAAGSATAIGVDNQQCDWEENLRPFYNCRVQIDDSIKFLQYYLGPDFNIIHIDTIHEPGQVAQELEIALTRLAEGGVICIDDIVYSQEMADWWDSLTLTKQPLGGLHSTGFGVVVPNE